MSDYTARRDAARRRLGQARQATNGNRVVAVVGMPCSGKTTYVQQHMARGDVVVDFDAIAIALGSTEQWDHTPLLQGVAHAASDAAIARFQSSHTTCTLWLIATSVTQLDQYGLSNADVITMATTQAECLERAVKLGRSPAVMGVIRGYTE